ncbi:MAG: YggT family protein [Sphingobacteriia bacterium]|nr:YggT family protein [Sphingobacteriia bacterium]
MNLNPFLDLIITVLDLYSYGLIIYIILGWLINFDIINKFNPIVIRIYIGFNKLYEPLMRKIRSILPDLGSLDISPIVIFLAIQLLQSLIYNYLYY